MHKGFLVVVIGLTVAVGTRLCVMADSDDDRKREDARFEQHQREIQEEQQRAVDRQREQQRIEQKFYEQQLEDRRIEDARRQRQRDDDARWRRSH